jgi:hypothetical protein
MKYALDRLSLPSLWPMQVGIDFIQIEVVALLEILSFATNHHATSTQLVVCNYLGHVCNYKFGIV